MKTFRDIERSIQRLMAASSLGNGGDLIRFFHSADPVAKKRGPGYTRPSPGTRRKHGKQRGG